MPSFNVDTTADEVVQRFGSNAKGKTFVITGPSAGGIGAVVAVALAAASPQRIILAGRSVAKIQPVADEIVKISNSETIVTIVELDLTDFLSVRRAAAKINSAAYDGIDGLYNNAGVMASREFETSACGAELQFTANHLGHFLFTNLLISDIAKAKGVVTNAASRAWALSDPNYDDMNFENGKTYHGWIAYSRSKIANIHFSIVLAKRVKHMGVAVYGADPGMALDSNLTKNSGVDEAWLGEGFRIATERADGEVPNHPVVTLQQAAATATLTLLDPAFRESSGAYLLECQIRNKDLADYATSAEQAEKLWKISEKFVGESFSL